MLINNGLCVHITCSTCYYILVMVVNSVWFQILWSYSSRPFLWALGLLTNGLLGVKVWKTSWVNFLTSHNLWKTKKLGDVMCLYHFLCSNWDDPWCSSQCQYHSDSALRAPDPAQCLPLWAEGGTWQPLNELHSWDMRLGAIPWQYQSCSRLEFSTYIHSGKL